MDQVRFFVAGVPKAGTTALCQFLGQHPQLFMCPIKEPSFFAASELLAIEVPWMRSSIDRKASAVERWVAGTVPDRPVNGLALHWDSYQALFDDARDQLAVGEGSTAYWSAPGAPGAIRDRFPAARFILMLRNPADRFFSQYLSMRWSKPLRTCRDCFVLARERHEEWGAVLDLGCYATHLRRFFGYFPRRQFSTHLYEDFCADPQAVCREIFAFLGVDADHPVDVSGRANEPILPRSSILHALRQSIARPYALSTMVPPRWREPLRRLYRKPRSREAMDPADRRAIIDYHRDEILQTSELIGRDLSSWLR